MTPNATRQNYNITLVVLVLAGLGYALLQSLVAPALPNIQHALHTSETSTTWLLTGYLLSASVATPIVGRLGDMFGKERVMLIVLALVSIGAVLAATATTIEVLIGARIIQGVGAGVFPLAFGIIRDEFPRDKVAGGVGLISAVLGIGAGAGVVLAGVIVDNLSYHWLFWIPLVFNVIAAVATYMFVPESPVKAPGKINWLGAALMSSGLSALLIAISQGSTWGWLNGRTLGLFAVAAVVLIAWIAAEARSDEPLVDMTMMRIRGVWTTNLVAFLLGVGMYSSFIIVPLLVELPTSTGFGFGASVTEAGLFLLPCTLMVFAGGILAGRIEGLYGSKPPLIAGAIASFAAFVMLAISHSTKFEIYFAGFLLGIGIGLAYAAMANLIVENVRQDQTGVATGMNTVMRTLGGAVGAQIVISLISSHSQGGLPTDDGFTIAFVVCAVALVAAIAAAIRVPSRATGPHAVADHIAAEAA